MPPPDCSKLEVALQPQHFRLINDSHKHAGHYVKDGSAACDAGETHFRQVALKLASVITNTVFTTLDC